jgi:hypothetical protein
MPLGDSGGREYTYIQRPVLFLSHSKSFGTATDPGNIGTTWHEKEMRSALTMLQERNGGVLRSGLGTARASRFYPVSARPSDSTRSGVPGPAQAGFTIYLTTLPGHTAYGLTMHSKPNRC